MTFDYNKICRLCLNSSNTYLMNIFNSEYNIVEKISDLVSLEVFQNDPFPKVICTDCYSNLVIFNEFKKICCNADNLLRKYQINKADSPEMDTTHSTKGNGKCKSIRNSDDMAQRIRETAYKKSLTFVENMKSFYFLLNQIEDLENGSAQAIIKNEISTESLIPTVEINIKNEVIYPNEENQMIQMGSVIQQNPESSAGVEPKRKKRKNNKRKPVNGQTMEIDETGNIVARQIIVSHEQPQQQQQHQNIQISTQNDNEMALMLTVKSVDEHEQQTIQQPAQIQIHSNHALPSISHHPSSSATSTVTTSPQTITFLFPFSASTSTAGAPNEHHYQQVTLPQSSVSQIVTTTIQPPANQQFAPFTHKKYFDSEFLKHMIHNAAPSSAPSTQPIAVATSAIQKVATIIERDRNNADLSAIPTDLSSSTSTQYK